MGGMAAFIPSRRDAEVNAAAFVKVKADKTREAGDGFDGSWVAHPDLVPICQEVFDHVLGDKPNQLDRRRDDVEVTAAELLDELCMTLSPALVGTAPGPLGRALPRALPLRLLHLLERDGSLLLRWSLRERADG